MAFVDFLCRCDVGDSSGKYFVFRGEFVLSVFNRLLFFGLFGLLSEASEVLLRLSCIFLLVLLSLNRRLSFLPLDWRLALCGTFLVLLPFLSLFRLFLLLLGLVFRRHGVKHSCWLYAFLSIDERRDVNNLSLVLV